MIVLNTYEYVIFVTYTLNSQFKLWSHHQNYFQSHHQTKQSNQFTNTAYPHALSTYGSALQSLSMESKMALNQSFLISKHLTLEWWLLAGEYACCLSRLHLKKMTEFLSDTYSTACVRRARSHYTRLLWSFSNFPKLGWPLLSGKLDWLEWFSLERLCCWCSYTKAKA